MKAFPSNHDPKTGTMQLGMELRDYFAVHCFEKIGMFPQTLNVGLDGNLTERQQEDFDKYVNASAKLAYQMADAMMKARDA